MPNKFTAIDPQGVTHKRTSQNRSYAFTVVVLAGQAYLDSRRPNEIEIKKLNDESWDRVENEAKGIFPKSEQWRGSNALASWKKFAIEWMSEHTREGVLAEAIAHAHKCYDQCVMVGDDLKYFNAGWCSRRDLAEKLADTQRGKGYEDVQILVATKVGG